MPTTVRVPAQLDALYDAAEKYVRAYFDTLQRNPEAGTIHVANERYVLVRAASLTTGFIEVMRDVIGEEEALKFWYRMARVIGRDDAAAFWKARGLEDSLSRLAMGPIHFAFSGWARVELDDRSRPSSDENCYLEYTHPNTFESETYVAKGVKTSSPVCVFSAGYSAGWSSDAFGVELHCREIHCVAAGASECRFILAPWERLDAYAAEVLAR
jgi:predicted hydrocarbon binding protein